MKANKLLKIKHILKAEVFPSASALMVDLHKGKNKSVVEQTELQVLQFLTGKQLQIVYNYLSQIVS